MSLLLAGRLGGFGIYIVANQLFFALARSLGLRIGVAVAGPIIGRTLAFLLGPSGWALATVWLFLELVDTNWKKTIAAVTMIAAFRRRFAWETAQEIGG